MSDEQLFNEVLSHFQEKYPKRRIESNVSAWGLIISIDGEERFNATGYNLLYNLKRLCDALESELR